MDGIVSDSTLRAATWILERTEKADHLNSYRAGVPERLFLAVETSVETGVLGTELLGIPAYTWILAAGVLLLVLALIRFLRRRLGSPASALLLVFAVLIVRSPEQLPVRFYADDPLSVDPDTLPFPAPKAYPFSESFNLFVNVIGLTDALDGPALNVNTMDEVPSSSWFTERMGPEGIESDVLVRGPNQGSGPDRTGVWKVVNLERDGKSTGMQITDALGDIYFLKLDALGHPETSTGAEVVSAKILYALGYYVPETYRVRFHPDSLTSGSPSVSSGQIERLLQLGDRRDDGTYRAVASKHVEGEPIGPFRLYGTRPDDPNDIFPHELRRELRGLRVVASWLNHTDMRAENTLSTVVQGRDGAFVRHYLLDFGTTLGGSPLGVQPRWAGYEYRLQPLPTLRRTLTFGLVDSEWETVGYPDIRGVGRFEAAHFDPTEWVPFEPNPAFLRMDAADAFWAAERIGRFTDEAIRAVVETGGYSDSRAAEYLAKILSERRDRILEAYLPFGGGVSGFRISADSVTFTDLLFTFGRVDAVPMRDAVWYAVSAEDEQQIRLAALPVGSTSLKVPESEGRLLRLDLTTRGRGVTRVYVRGEVGSRRLVGLERCDDRAACSPLADRQAARERLFAQAYGE